jgi:hypothetical protein
MTSWVFDSQSIKCKNNVQHFLWMKESRKPNSIVWKMMPKLLGFKDAKSSITWFLFLAFFVLFCTLWWSGLGELVSVMERDPCYSINNIYGSVSHSSWRQLVLSFQRSGGRWTRNKYMKLAKEEDWKDFSFGSGRN